MSELRAIKNHIVFQFTDEFSNRDVKQFKEVTEWGFEVVSHKDSMEAPRWVDIVAVGPDVYDELQPGMRVLLEPLKWTEAFTYNNIDYWRTDAEAVLAIAEE